MTALGIIEEYHNYPANALDFFLQARISSLLPEGELVEIEDHLECTYLDSKSQETL